MQFQVPIARRALLPVGVLFLLGIEARAQSINIDFGDVASAPSAGYGAAGLAGSWNPIGVLPSGVRAPLVRLDGSASSAKIYMIGGTALLSADEPATGGDDAALIDDMLIGFNDPVDVCIWIESLENGLYEVTTYALTPDDPLLESRVRVDDGNPGPVQVGGAWPGSHQERVTFARHQVTISGGVIGLHSGLFGGEIQSGINGIQIRRITAADAESREAPTLAGALQGVAPNPGQGHQELRLMLPEGLPHATLTIIAPDGRQVWSTHLDRPRGGPQVYTWDGRRTDGTPAASGSYWLRLESPGLAPTSARLLRLR